ncbi:Epoxide hydrolase-2 [Melia azedarach]|uniref:Epoxide hydrolase-2 n=1 Tax=Melia azedarach TaxID=155640 RepID=A0ACC1YFM5_MELAZ|nr:Epoxide hydrolase-2 [Melia azedarach]
MEDIQHRTVNGNGIKMDVAEKGEGPFILFLHGFPELWYFWPHQINALSSLGYRAVVPDLRGYGDTDAPAPLKSYTCLHVVGDLVGLLEVVAADQEKVYWWDMIRGRLLHDFRNLEREAGFARIGTETVLKGFFTLSNPAPLYLRKGTGNSQRRGLGIK